MATFGNFFVRPAAAVVLAASLAAPSLAAGSAPSVAITPRGGVFTSNVVVALVATAGEIRYTLDGSEPGTNAPLYAGPLSVTNPVVVKARAFAAGTNIGATAVEAFSTIDSNAAAFASTLPLVVIHTFGQPIPPASNAPVWMQVIAPGANQRATVTELPDFNGPVKIKPRGFTSLRQPKKSYAVETLDRAGEAAPVTLLGMPADSEWVLYAPYSDKTLMRDALAYELSNKLGHYASRTRFVEVFVNDTTNSLARGHYAGVYVLEEKMKVGRNRVAIHKLTPQDNAEPAITGGYLFKKDHLEKAGADLPPEGPAHSKPAPLIGKFPTGPGGFPAAATGFLPSLDPPTFSNALSIVTNSVVVTNYLAATNTTVTPPSVTIVRTNFLVVTNSVAVTNSAVATNLVVTTNFPVVTNVTVTSQTVVATNPVVATQSVVGTNTIATTNAVDANTVVINTTVAIVTSATYRTNFTVTTNTFALTNALVITNMLVATNSTVVTNVSVASVPVVETNPVLRTNVFTIGRLEPLPGSSRLVESGDGFVTSNANAFFFVEPKPAKIIPEQRAWLTNYLNRFEAALYSPDFRNATNGYAAFIDVDSFIDHHLFVEATKNIDGFRFSTFFTKERGGKLKMGPIWDWNLSFGNAKGKQGYMAAHWYWPQLNDQQYSWFRRLFEDPEFGQRYVDRWARWRTNVFATSNLAARVDELAAALKEPAARNYERWPILGQTVEHEYFGGKTYEEEIQNLKTWITNRMAWIDAQFVPPPAISHVAASTDTADALSFAAPTGQIYFTTDGTDPRHASGDVSGNARVYESPVSLTNAAVIVARARHTNRWSSPVALRVAGKPAR